MQLGAAWTPLLSLWVLRHFDVPSAGLGWLWAVVMVIGVLGSFVILMPGLNPFLASLGNVLSALQGAAGFQ